MPWMILAVLLGAVAVASADDAIQGFVTPATGRLTGKVTDHDGKPLGGVVVHLVAPDGQERTVTTAADGSYAAELAPGSRYSVVFVVGAAKIVGTAVAAHADGDAEAIELREVMPPEVPAQPKIDLAIVPPYSDQAVDDDTWARAWLVLDVGPTGVVTRVKLLDPPGHGLDAIAIRQAFKTEFEPARDRSDHPIHSSVLWTFEWPSFTVWQSSSHEGRHLPSSVRFVPCRRPGPNRGPEYRDCSQPTLSRVVSQPWIDHPPP